MSLKAIKITQGLLFAIALSASSLLGAQISFSGAPLVTTFTIEESGSNYSVVSLESGPITCERSVVNGTAYSQIALDGYGSIHTIGAPALPCRLINMEAPAGVLPTVTILDADTATLSDSLLIYPALKEAVDDAETPTDPKAVFTTLKEIYSHDAWYPANPVTKICEQEYRGVYVATLQICPILHNPVSRSIKVYKKLRLRIEYPAASISPAPLLTGRNNADAILNNIVVNGSASNHQAQHGSAALCDGINDVLIITQDSFLVAADTLARWERQKGYGVRILSKASWTTTAIKDSVSAFYTRTTPKPGYLLIIGDNEFVPGNPLTDDAHTYNNRTYYSDLYYVCMGGSSDFTGDMARGRISVSTKAQAESVVNKILSYERCPVTDSSFYKSSVFSAYFEDDDNDGYDDRRFAQTAEECRSYMASKGYATKRIYCTNSPNPLYWNNGTYSSGESIPSELKMSNGFTWSGTATDIASAWNTGTFLLLHRDHGYTDGSGWAHPDFTTTSSKGVNLLTNGSKQPVVFSLNCHTGEYNFTECFAESLLRKTNGGAVGIIGAAEASFSGYNDAFAEGLFDAIWPGLVLNAPAVKNPVVVTHTPIYTLGDVMAQGLFRMGETWYSGTTLQRYENELFHYFGDPTMEIWTGVPQNLTYVAGKIHPGSASYQITGLNITSGTATIYNPRTDSIIGCSNVSGSSVSIPVSGTFNNSDTLILTIRSHNFRPVIVGITAAAAKTYTVSTSASGGGTITPSGDSTVDSASSFTFSVMSSTGYQLDSVTINGIKISMSGSQYTISNISAAQTVCASFSLIPVTINTTKTTYTGYDTALVSGDTLAVEPDTIVRIVSNITTHDTTVTRIDSLRLSVVFGSRLDSVVTLSTVSDTVYDTIQKNQGDAVMNSGDAGYTGVKLQVLPSIADVSRMQSVLITLSSGEKSISSASLKLYDPLGALVFADNMSRKTKGTAESAWNLRTPSGAAAGNGMYEVIARVRFTDGSSRTIKTLAGLK